VPLTAFVVMCLAATGRAEHPVVRKGVEFLLATVRSDGSWPIEANLSLRNTALATSTLASAREDLRKIPCLHWILAAQRHVQAAGGAASNDATVTGWSWTDRPGGIVSAGDTSHALLALSAFGRADARQHAKILPAALAGVRWLLDLQNTDGGFPAFARGQALIRDGSASDLTAHSLRALHAWRTDLVGDENLTLPQRQQLGGRIARALEAGLRYLAAAQQRDGAWIPLWFGNQNRPQLDNPLYGTTAVLFALRDLGRLDSPATRRALDYLVSRQRANGSFGASDATAGPASVEETALAVEALLTCGQAEAYESSALRGLKWLIDAVEANHHTEAGAIGLFFDRLWYYERLYPLIMSTGALGQAVRKYLPTSVPRTVAHFGNL
jgi:squalene-hopene/tetraprenyl-beta-curcumene cyclase